MNAIANEFERAGVVTRLAELNPHMGRTALMKYAYLLQEVKGVPLGYDFILFNYGPYDAGVLTANNYAKHLGAVREVPEDLPGGMRKNRLERGPNAAELMEVAGEFVDANADAIQWVVDEFKSYNAGEMELIGTMVFADREAKAEGKTRSKGELLDIVLQIKFHYPRDKAEKLYDEVKPKGVFVAVRE